MTEKNTYGRKTTDDTKNRPRPKHEPKKPLMPKPQ